MEKLEPLEKVVLQLQLYTHHLLHPIVGEPDVNAAANYLTVIGMINEGFGKNYLTFGLEDYKSMDDVKKPLLKE